MNKRSTFNQLNFLRVPEIEPAVHSRGFFRRAIRAFRLPTRWHSPIEEAAAEGRAARLFAANFKSTWTR